MSASEQISIAGAREHNLKDVSLSIPRDALVVITGLSGSGKSSLAFDTIYAEGQRRYVESLSAYARQFLGQMDKPDVDSIEGLSPAISIDQKTTSRNPRSTVGTVTEIYDYLRLLWARIGKPHCHICGRPITGSSAEQIVDQVMELGEGTRFMVMAPIVRGRKGEYGKLLQELRSDGFQRVKIDGRLRMLEESIVLDKRYKHDISVVIDRLIMRHEIRKRLSDSIETAVGLADGLVEVELMGDAGGAGTGSPVAQTEAGGSDGRAGRRGGAPEEPSGAAGVASVSEDGSVLTFSERFACPEHGPSLTELEPRIFSFNSPHGACERCTGLGAQMEIDIELIVPDDSLSVSEGAILPWKSAASNYYEQVAQAISERYEVDLDAPWRDLPQAHRDMFLHGVDGEKLKITYRNRFGRSRTYGTRFAGVIANLERRHRETDSEGMREKIEEFMSLRPCPACGGARLRPESRAVLVGGTRIEDFTALSAVRALQWLDEVSLTETEQHVARLILREISERLQFLVNVGIGYLSMERAAATLSGGEAQRVKMVGHLGSPLTDVTYVFDEPTIGLHPHDVQRMNELLLRLRDKGNTVLIVEHDPETIAVADHVIDLGPGAGVDGGTVCFEGPADSLRASGTITGRHLADRTALKQSVRAPAGTLQIRGAATHNLQDVDVDVSLGVLVAITGVAGSGKSSLIDGSVSGRDGVVSIDQSAIRGSRRSNPATYTGLLEPIRKAFAKANGVGPALFSANSEGACPACNGLGVIYTDLAMMAGVAIRCEECEGRRYQAEVLGHKLAGRDIGEVLAMPVIEAQGFFADGDARTPAAHAILERLAAVGLGYLTLGQPLPTLSGGERQRLKLATEMSQKGGIYVLDEPTAGLHLADVQHLLGLLDRLVDSGRSVIVIEHHQAVIAHADWIIDLGPGAGHEGGRIVFAGTPAELAAGWRLAGSLTGEHLAAYLHG